MTLNVRLDLHLVYINHIVLDKSYISLYQTSLTDLKKEILVSGVSLRDPAPADNV